MDSSTKDAVQITHRGVLVIGSDGKELACSGIAARDGMSRCIADAWRDARWSQRHVFPVQADDGTRCVVVALPTPDASVLVAMESDGRDSLFELAGSVDFAGDLLAHLLTNPLEALTVVDRKGILRFMSPEHERAFAIQPGAAVGKHITDVIDDARLHDVADSGKSEVGTLQDLRGVSRVVARHAVRDGRGQTVGAMGRIMLADAEQFQSMPGEPKSHKLSASPHRRELVPRGLTDGLLQMVGDSAAMRNLKQQLMKVAPLDVPVLLTGESGTGKELAANALHKLSQRCGGTLVTVNAAALPSTLVESELFGYDAGAFTGAERKGRKGKIEQADAGTLFFDEVGDMPADVQVKLLRVLEDGGYQRVGSNDGRQSNFRLISASNRDFEAMIADGSFRLDLFYRIGCVTVRMPSLSERLDDIPQLAEVALRQFAERHGQPVKSISPEALQFLRTQRWPGNVRQLMHAIERAAIFAESDVIGTSDFGAMHATMPEVAIQAANEPRAERIELVQPTPAWRDQTSVSSAVEQVEAHLIREGLVRCQGNKKRVAVELGISRSYLYKRLAQMGVASEAHG